MATPTQHFSLRSGVLPNTKTLDTLNDDRFRSQHLARNRDEMGSSHQGHRYARRTVGSIGDLQLQGRHRRTYPTRHWTCRAGAAGDRPEVNAVALDGLREWPAHDASPKCDWCRFQPRPKLAPPSVSSGPERTRADATSLAASPTGSSRPTFRNALRATRRRRSTGSSIPWGTRCPRRRRYGLRLRLRRVLRNESVLQSG